MVLHGTKKIKESGIKSVDDYLNEAKIKNNQIKSIIPQIEDPDLVNNIREINDTVNKIIETVERNPEKFKKINNFFEYYLPVTIKILKKYDEIENQRLTTEESKEFMKSTQDMIEKINQAFKNQLSNLYQSDMIDTDAEMKVFESMLKSEGYDDKNDFKMK